MSGYTPNLSSGTITINGGEVFKTLNFFPSNSFSSQKVVMPYLYPVYSGYSQDISNNKNVINGLQYEAFDLNSNGSLNYFGDQGVTSTLQSLGVAAWPMIVNDYNITKQTLKI